MLPPSPRKDYTEAISAPQSPVSGYRGKLAMLLATVLSVAGCQDDTTGSTVPDHKDAPEPVASQEFPGLEKPLAERCNEYPYPACYMKLTKAQQRQDFHCFTSKVPEGLNIPVIWENAYSALLDYDGEGFGQSFCNPYSLNANPDLHHLMKARFLSLNPEMIAKYDVSNSEFLNKRMDAFNKEKDQAFGKLLADFREVERKCIRWNDDPEHKLLPGACLLALDNKDTSVTISPSPSYPRPF